MKIKVRGFDFYKLKTKIDLPIKQFAERRNSKFVREFGKNIEKIDQLEEIEVSTLLLVALKILRLRGCHFNEIKDIQSKLNEAKSNNQSNEELKLMIIDYIKFDLKTRVWLMEEKHEI